MFANLSTRLLLRHWPAATAVLMAAVTAAHLGFGRLGDGMSFLYVVPVCVAAVGGGRRAAVLAAVLATALVAGWAELRQVPVPLEGYVIRVAAFALVGLYIANLERRLLERVHLMAHSDVLTGLPNRRAWDEELEAAVARARRSSLPLAVGMVDVDHFKRYNDEHGHSGGDRLLRAAAAAWQGALRRSDFLARFGGEEFSFILWDCDPSAAAALAERLRESTPAGATCSVGVAAWDQEEDAETLLRRADQALYRAKDAGRDRVVFDQAAGGRSVSPAMRSS